MKALSLWQPWASAIVMGRKHIETRHWSTNYRGPLLIHAAKRPMTRDDRDFFEVEMFDEVEEMGFGSVEQMALLIPYGAIVAICQLVDVVPTRDILDLGDLTPNPHAERLWGDYTLGRYAWVLHDIEPINPIPTPGHQGLWNYDFNP
jgi:hypothetical protein